MRLAAVPLALVLAAPAPAAGPAPAAPVDKSTAAQPSKECPRTTSYFAGRGSMYQGVPLAPRKLNELPPATTYMAVVRKIGGCEVPLTMTEYRSGRRTLLGR